MEYGYHVSNIGIPSGTILLPDYHGNKEKVSVFFRALCQSPEIFCSTLTSAQYSETIFKSLIPTQGGPNAAKWATEGIFDFVRTFHYPNRPARFSSVYVFREIEQAEQFIREYRKNTDSGIYKCLIENCIKFESDMNIFTAVNDRIVKAQVNPNNPLHKQLKEIVEMVKAYWEPSKTINIPEILLSGGSISIVERVK